MSTDDIGPAMNEPFIPVGSDVMVINFVGKRTLFATRSKTPVTRGDCGWGVVWVEGMEEPIPLQYIKKVD